MARLPADYDPEKRSPRKCAICREPVEEDEGAWFDPYGFCHEDCYYEEKES
jgi:hypothetical protein